MTRKRVELGAPSLTGRVAELIAETFAGCVYPVEVEAVNRMPHDITLSEVRGLYLRGVTVSDGSNKKVVQIESEDQFIRLASSVQQIAALNGHEYAVMTIETIAGDELEPEPEPVPEPEPEPEGDKPAGEDKNEGEETPVEGEATPPQANDEATETDAHKKVSSKKSGKSHANSSKNGG
ncbi:MAG: hypothetical protein ABTQ25_03575 [Nitrosomonas ureae]